MSKIKNREFILYNVLLSKLFLLSYQQHTQITND